MTLDHFFASGGNSADGHQWLTQSNEVAYTLWPGYAGRSYPFDGTDPIAYAPSLAKEIETEYGASALEGLQKIGFKFGGA